MSNEILEEVWAARGKLWARYGGDLDQYFEHLREVQDEARKAGRVMVNRSRCRELASARVAEDPPAHAAR